MAILSTVLVLGLLGRVWWVFDLASNYRPHLGLALLVAAMLSWVIDRNAAIASLFFGVVGVLPLLFLYVGSNPSPGEEPTLEIVSFNVGVSNPNRSEVAAYLARENPDLVFLFESSFEWEDAIREADVPLTMVAVVPRGRLAGVTVLASSALSPAAINVDFWREATAVSLTLDGRRLEVLGVHPPSPTTGRRSDRRDRVLADAADWVAARDVPVVLVGDLNVTPWSAAYRSLLWRGGLIDTLKGSGYQASWPVGWGVLAIPIDHVLHTRDLGSTDRRTGPSFGSAHRPLSVSLGFVE